MADAIIGYSGFVGSNLTTQRSFDASFNSKNFQKMRNGHFRDVVCAGVSAVKWLANKEPEEDLRNILRLQDILATVVAERFILISTIDVYPVLDGVGESFECHDGENHAYGTHRLMFEDFIREHFQRAYVIRLPALFGPGLKKNVIYDLLNDNCLESINLACSFQYYDTLDLWQDIKKVLKADINLVNFLSEPVPTREIVDRFFRNKEVGQQAGPECHYNLFTEHASIFGQHGKYALDADRVIAKIGAFVASCQSKKTCTFANSRSQMS